jgi:hopanoid biosynthesis associated RND transporter like protein HpnN
LRARAHLFEESELKSRIDAQLATLIARWIDLCRLNSGRIILICTAITLASAAYAVQNLGINSDNVRLVAEHLPSRQNHEAFARLFPNLENALLVVVDGETAEVARNSADALEARIRSEQALFTDAYQPGGGAFFETHGLLYRDVDELETFSDQMARMQPILAALEQQPNIATLAELVELGLADVQAAEPDASVSPEDWATILDSVGEATLSVYNEFPLAMSWEQMLSRGQGMDPIKRRIIVVHPILDFGSVLAAGRAMEEIRGYAVELGQTPERGVRVRITGNPALNYEEMIGMAWDLGGGGIVCFFVVLIILTRALRSIKLVIAAVVTLLVGLIWTAAFAAAAVENLSLVSTAFGVLFIGLGVDFGIHLGMAYASRLRLGVTHASALRDGAESVGASLAICTLTTAIGFYVFVPTDYLGVAELGLISGTGMFIIFALTLTLFPALLSGWLQTEPADIPKALHFRTTWWRMDDKQPNAVCIVSVVLLAFGLSQIPAARFDVNVIEMRDPTTESVQAFDDLLSDSGELSPWFINSIAPDLASADEIAARMRALSSVSNAITLSDYVPTDQEEKIEVLGDLAFMLDVPPLPARPAPPDMADQIAALKRLYDFLSDPTMRDAGNALGTSVQDLRRKLGDFLARVENDDEPERALETLEALLLSGLPEQMQRLRVAVDTGTIELDDLPPRLRDRMIARTGEVRVQVFPRHDLSNEAAFVLFTDEVRALDPNAAGVAVNLVTFGRATRASFEQALLSAVIIVSLLLLIVWRSVAPMLLVMTPLMLSSTLTVAAMVLLDIPFNFANVIVIPLLLGIGVDSGIHLVHRAEAMRETEGDLLDSTTARAVFYSALTTTLSFGTLALSSHRGLASLGIVLSVGMLLTILSNLVVLPALIQVSGFSKPRSETGSESGSEPGAES